ncbi:hypothetical protein V2J09_023071 [Rumex salicifolius]
MMNKGPTTSAGGGANDAVDHFYRARGLNPLFTQLQLTLSAKKLRDMDIMSKSDPMAVLYLKKRNGTLEEIGHTEIVTNSLDPCWTKTIPIAYQFEIVQPLVFHVYDIDTAYHNLPVKAFKFKDQDFVGEANCTLSEIVTKRDCSLTMKLHDRTGRERNFGELTVHAEEAVSIRNVVELLLHCTRLDNLDFFSKRWTSFANMQYRSCDEQSKSNMEAHNSDYATDNPLIIECFDHNSNGNHELIGKIQKSMVDLENMHKHKTGANFVKPHKGREKVLKGQIFVDSFIEKQLYTFLEYISSGFELSFMVAVDFTGSNGDPRSPNSLHYVDPSGRLNAYQQAIMDVGQVIQFYDTDRHFHAWGFGGMYNGSVSHCFNLNGSPHPTEVQGVEGIMAAYSYALHTVRLAGPTLFSNVIYNAAEIVAQSLHNNSKYYVLLIITDGVLTDIQETKDALVKASDLPLSILIIGVGNADFTQMEILDGDGGTRLKSSTGQVATRDIVQFVPMRDVQGDEMSILQCLLEELPEQFLTYMRSKGIKPHIADFSLSVACLLRQQGLVDIRKNTSVCNCNATKQLAQLFIIPHSKLYVAGNYPVLLVVSRSIPSKFQNLITSIISLELTSKH